MRLRNVNEVPSIRREIDRVMIRRVGEALIVFAIEADAMQLQLHRITAVAGRVVEQGGFLIHAHDVGDFK